MSVAKSALQSPAPLLPSPLRRGPPPTPALVRSPPMQWPDCSGDIVVPLALGSSDWRAPDFLLLAALPLGRRASVPLRVGPRHPRMTRAQRTSP